MCITIYMCNICTDILLAVWLLCVLIGGRGYLFLYCKKKFYKKTQNKRVTFSFIFITELTIGHEGLKKAI